jgi:hypothetical protein
VPPSQKAHDGGAAIQPRLIAKQAKREAREAELAVKQAALRAKH